MEAHLEKLLRESRSEHLLERLNELERKQNNRLEISSVNCLRVLFKRLQQVRLAVCDNPVSLAFKWMLELEKSLVSS